MEDPLLILCAWDYHLEGQSVFLSEETGSLPFIGLIEVHLGDCECDFRGETCIPYFADDRIQVLYELPGSITLRLRDVPESILELLDTIAVFIDGQQTILRSGDVTV